MARINKYILCMFFIQASSGYLWQVSGNQYDRLIKQYKKEIQTKSGDLENLKKEIEQKKIEKTQYEKQEKTIRSELNAIEKEINNLNSDITKMENEIISIKKKSVQVEKDMKLAGMEVVQWKSILKAELGRLYKDHYCLDYIIENPWNEILKRYALKTKVDYITVASAREDYSKSIYEKYNVMQSNLKKLNVELVGKKERQKIICDDKARLYTGVRDKRICAEEELKTLNESAKALKNLLGSIEDKKKKTQELKEKEELDRRSFGKKRKSIPCPVPGEVVLKFGKNKHATLDTYVISNGLKIQAKTREVTAVEKGEVVYSQQFRSYGKTIIIDHGAEIYTIYGGLDEIVAMEGTSVKTSDVIGKITPGKLLYFEISIKNEAQDPLEWLNPGN